MALTGLVVKPLEVGLRSVSALWRALRWSPQVSPGVEGCAGGRPIDPGNHRARQLWVFALAFILIGLGGVLQ
jgi:hypothetical protein